MLDDGMCHPPVPLRLLSCDTSLEGVGGGALCAPATLREQVCMWLGIFRN